MNELTNKQEDLVLEQLKCDYCGGIFPKDEMYRHDDLDICEACHMGAIE